MRITIVQGAFMPVPPILGTSVEKIWFALGKEFARRGHQVTHISREHPALNREEDVEGVHYLRIPGFDVPRSLARLKWRDLRYSRRVLKVLPEADILVTNTFWLPVLAPRAAKGKIYIHVARYPRGQMRFYGKAARLQTVSTVISNAICREAPKLAAKVKVIPNFVSRSGPAPAGVSGSRWPSVPHGQGGASLCPVLGRKARIALLTALRPRFEPRRVCVELCQEQRCQQEALAPKRIVERKSSGGLGSYPAGQVVSEVIFWRYECSLC